MLTEILILFFCFVAALVFSSFQRRKSKAPPGPWAVPFLGHLLFLGQFPHKTLLTWSKRYGPLMTIQFGSFPTIVISEAQLIKKVFSSSKIAGRPFIKLLDDISYRKGIVFSDGTGTREQRQFMMRHLKEFGAHGQSMELRILAEVENLLTNLNSHVEQPLNISNFYYRNVVNSLLSILLSKKFETGDPTVAEFAEIISKNLRIDGILEGLGLFVPKLAQWFPNAVGYTYKLEGARKIQAFVQDLVDEHKETRVKGQPRDPTDAYLDLSEAITETDSSFHPNANNLVESLFDTFIAGSDTTSNSLEWTTYYLSKHPEILAKLQTEIDAVVGQECMPNLTDRPAMVYTEAFICEILRKSSVVPLGITHRATEDETVEGFLIPKDTSVVANIYAVHHDPDVWGDPDNFRPERWIDADGKVKKSDQLIAFSAGKRYCIGEPVARMQLFLFIVSIFQKFDVKAVGKLPSCDGYGLTLAPSPFEATFIKRVLV